MSGDRVRDLVVIAASAGGVEALGTLMSELPPGFPAAVLVVLHVPAAGGGALPRILSRAGKLPAATAADGETPRPGHVYVAPPDHHMLLMDRQIRLSRGPRHNGHRPAADPLFMSAAMAKGPQVIGVVLSGTLDDGAAGCAAVERRGGLVMIQDPAESAYEGMPRAAIAASRRPQVMRLHELVAAIGRHVREPLPEVLSEPDPDLSRQLSVFLGTAPEPVTRPIAWSGVSCPECGGPLTQEDAASPVRFRCPAGHAWSPESLVVAQASGIERALWSAVLRLEERARLNRVLAETADCQGQPATAGAFLTVAQAAESSARQIRALLVSMEPPAPAG